MVGLFFVVPPAVTPDSFLEKSDGLEVMENVRSFSAVDPEPGVVVDLHGHLDQFDPSAFKSVVAFHRFPPQFLVEVRDDGDLLYDLLKLLTLTPLMSKKGQILRFPAVKLKYDGRNPLVDRRAIDNSRIS